MRPPPPSLSACLAALFLLSACSNRQRVPDEAYQACVEVLVNGHLEASGWFCDPDGHVITAGHAARHKGTYEILWPDHGRFPATVLGWDPGHDVGLLKMEKPGGPVPFLKLANRIPPVGTTLQLYGMAQYRHGVSIRGNVARSATTFNYYAHLRWPTRCYLVAAPAPPGVSGGPWIDSRGRVAGTQSGFINQGTASSGLAIVAPPDAIAHILQTKGHVPRATMGCGFEELWSQPSGFIKRLPTDAEGVVTIPIEASGPAEKAGLTSENVIRSVNGRPVRYQHEIIEILQAASPGDTLDLSIWGPDAIKPGTTKITLGSVPP